MNLPCYINHVISCQTSDLDCSFIQKGFRYQCHWSISQSCQFAPRPHHFEFLGRSVRTTASLGRKCRTLKYATISTKTIYLHQQQHQSSGPKAGYGTNTIYIRPMKREDECTLTPSYISKSVPPNQSSP